MADMAYQVRLTLGDHADEFDIPAIVADLRQQHEDIGNIDDISGEAFWAIIKRHDPSAKETRKLPDPPKMPELGRRASGTVVDVDDWGGKNPPIIRPRRRAYGTVCGGFPAAPNVVRIQCADGTRVAIRTDI